MAARHTQKMVLTGASVAALLGAAFLLFGLANQDPLSPKIAESLDVSCPGCNVLLITIDTVRADHLACLGGRGDVAPRICQLGREGWTFERALSPAPWTIPALTALLSGGLPANRDVYEILAFYEKERFLAELLAAGGYRTVGMTDHWGLGDRKRVHMGAANLLRGFAEFINIGTEEGGVKAPALTEEVLGWLGRHGDEKFFLWAHYFDPHYPFEPAASEERRFGFDPGSCGRIEGGMPIDEINGLGDGITERELDCVIALHQAEIHATDAQIGRVLDRLAELGLHEKTVVIITADHGEEFRERSWVGHEKTVHDELIHVPLFVMIPGTAARRVPTPVTTMVSREIARGVLAPSRAQLPADVISRTFHFHPTERDGQLAFETAPDDFALVEGAKKLIWSPESEARQFYALDADPGEKENRWPSDPGKPLARRLERWSAENARTTGEPSADTRHRYQETMERLKKLGYVK